MKKMAFVLLIIIVTGCAGVPRKENSVTVNLRKDVFLNKPVWESTDFNSTFEIKKDGNSTKIFERIKESAPALAGLAKQVLGEPFDQENTRHKVEVFERSKDSNKQAVIRNFSIKTNDPLPPDIANDPVTKSVVSSMVKSYGGAERLSNDEIKIENMNISMTQFRDFQYLLMKESIESYTSKEHTFVDSNATKEEGITIEWDMLFKKYIATHYKGDFIDRTGKKSSKPNIDLTISNETITDIFYIFLESLWDWALIDSHVKNPILYDKKNKKFLTAGGNTPTLYKFLKDVSNSNENDEILIINGVVEEVLEDIPEKKKQKDGISRKEQKDGISRLELCIVRQISGLAGDSAKAITGSVVRGFGGANLGFTLGLGALGKLSFGDNDTLTKMVDTWAESTGRRATESFASHSFYKKSFTDEKMIKYLKMLCGEK